MKKQILTIALALTLGAATLAHAGDVVPGPTTDNALSMGIGAASTLLLDATLTKAITPRWRTVLIFVGSTAISLIVEGEKAGAQNRAVDNYQLLYSLGGSVLAYEIHF